MDDWTHYAPVYGIVACLLAVHGLILYVALARRHNRLSARIEDVATAVRERAELLTGEVGARSVEVRADIHRLDQRLSPVAEYVDHIGSRPAGGRKPAAKTPPTVGDVAAEKTGDAARVARVVTRRTPPKS